MMTSAPPPPICTMLVEDICGPAELKSVAATTGMVTMVDKRGRPLRIQESWVRHFGVRIEHEAGDMLETVSNADLLEICRNEVCLVHQTVCQPDALICRYSFTTRQSGSTENTQLSNYIIWVREPGMRKALEKRLWVRVQTKTGKVDLPFSMLNEGVPPIAGTFYRSQFAN